MEKKQYTAPELTVVVFKAERGYFLSGESPAKVINIVLGNAAPDISSIQENWAEDNTTFAGDWTTNN